MQPLPCGEGTSTRLGDDALVVGRHLDRPRIVRLQHLQQRAGAHAADGEFLRAIQEGAAAHAAMHIDVEEVQSSCGKSDAFLRSIVASSG